MATAIRSNVSRAVRHIRDGGVILYPTEYVFGLGCDPWNQAAVQKILAIKGRSQRKGLILIASSVHQIKHLVEWPRNPGILDAISKTWPGPVTWVFACHPHIPRWLRGSHRSLAVRVTAHPLVQDLCRNAGPLVSTSANPSGAPAVSSLVAARLLFGKHVDFTLPGSVQLRGRGTEIRNAVDGRVLRPGPISTITAQA